MEQDSGVTFLRSEKVWLAIRPMGAVVNGRHAKQTEHIQYRDKKEKYNKRRHADVQADDIITEGKRQFVMRRYDRYPDYWVLAMTGTGASDYSGFALEIGEAATHHSYDQFKDRVLSHQQLGQELLSAGKVVFTDSRGQVLDLDHGGAFKQWC